MAGAVFVAEHSMTAKVATGRPAKENWPREKPGNNSKRAGEDDLSQWDPRQPPYKERKPSGGDPMYPATRELHRLRDLCQRLPDADHLPRGFLPS